MLFKSRNALLVLLGVSLLTACVPPKNIETAPKPQEKFVAKWAVLTPKGEATKKVGNISITIEPIQNTYLDWYDTYEVSKTANPFMFRGKVQYEILTKTKGRVRSSFGLFKVTIRNQCKRVYRPLNPLFTVQASGQNLKLPTLDQTGQPVFGLGGMTVIPDSANSKEIFLIGSLPSESGSIRLGLYDFNGCAEGKNIENLVWNYDYKTDQKKFLVPPETTEYKYLSAYEAESLRHLEKLIKR